MGHWSEFDFPPTSVQLSRAVKADKISVLEPTQPLRLAQQIKRREARAFVQASLLLMVSELSIRTV